MKHSRKLTLFASFLILTIFIGACGSMTKEDNKEAQIKKSFEKTLGMYPIKNLEDLYDKEGYRDEEFDKDDKGTWLLYSRMSTQPKGKDLESRGMVIKINRNTKSANGEYVINTFSSDEK
ncbi:tandem-type lipoprotein, partial [Staphylococcus gallinarum]